MKIYRALLIFLILVFHMKTFADVKFNIKGVEDDEVENNISLYLDALTQPQNATNESYLRQINESVIEAMHAYGYYQMQIETNVTGEVGKQVVTLQIEQGQPVRITKLDIQLIGEGETDPVYQSLFNDFPLKINDILNHGKYEDAKSQIKRIAQRYGYFDSTFSTASVEVVSKKNTATVKIWFQTGVRYKFGELNIPVELAAEKFIHSLQNFEKGDLYDARILTKFNADINETGYFKNITIFPEINNKDGLLIPLNVVASMRPEDSFNVGLGVSTDEGLRGTFRWSRPWVNQHGHSIEGNLVASAYEQEASLVYKVPLEDPLYNYMSITSGYKLVNQNDTDTTQYIVGLNRHTKLSNDWLRTMYIRYDNESGRQGQQDFSTELILPGFSFGRTRTRGGINAHWGDRQLFYMEVSDTMWGSSDDLVKIYGQTKFLRTYNNHQFVTYAELGAIYTDSIYNVPSSMRFFTGGDQSIRGYDYESIAPRDESGYLIGGKYLAVASLEYRMPISQNWRFAVFVDAGTATDNIITDPDALSIGTGIGAVWASPVGPIRFYLAVPQTGDEDKLDKVRFHFMLGPEL